MLKTGSRKFRHAETHQIGTYLVELRNKYPNFLSNPLFLSKFDAALDGGVPGCSAGRAFFNIDSTGDIAICVEQRISPIANLYRDNMTTISKLLRQHSKGNTCQQCWYNCRGEIESLYNLYGLIKSLPTYLFDHGRPVSKPRPARRGVALWRSGAGRG
jgi:MoaA/NifB/PqqE/SkfB family radical SAM enzyme